MSKSMTIMALTLALLACPEIASGTGPFTCPCPDPCCGVSGMSVKVEIDTTYEPNGSSTSTISLTAIGAGVTGEHVAVQGGGSTLPVSMIALVPPPPTSCKITLQPLVPWALVTGCSDLDITC